MFMNNFEFELKFVSSLKCKNNLFSGSLKFSYPYLNDCGLLHGMHNGNSALIGGDGADALSEKFDDNNYQSPPF